MNRKSNTGAEVGIGLVCPACGLHPKPDPEALKAAVHDLRLWARGLERASAVMTALLSRLAERWRQAHSAPAHD